MFFFTLSEWTNWPKADRHGELRDAVLFEYGNDNSCFLLWKAFVVFFTWKATEIAVVKCPTRTPFSSSQQTDQTWDEVDVKVRLLILESYSITVEHSHPPSLSLPLPRFQHWKGVRQALLQNKLKPPTSTSHRLYVFSCFSCIFITFYPPQGHPMVSNSEVTVQVTWGSSIKSNGCSCWIDRTSNSKSSLGWWHMLLNWDCEIETCQSTEWVVFSLASQSVS